MWWWCYLLLLLLRGVYLKLKFIFEITFKIIRKKKRARERKITKQHMNMLVFCASILFGRVLLCYYYYY
jgi:hypothetical protein